MNKKGFTLVELLSVIALLAIIMLLAIPNIISIIEKGKKQAFLDDAKKFISLVEYQVNKNNSETDVFYLTDYNDKFNKDPSDGQYDMNKSCVIFVSNVTKHNEFQVTLCGSKMKIVGILSTDLSIDSVTDGACDQSVTICTG